MKSLRQYIVKILNEQENILGPNPEEDKYKLTTPKSKGFPFVGLYNNREITILLNKQDGEKYYFYHGDLTKEQLSDYAETPSEYLGRDEDGNPEIEYFYDEIDITPEVVAEYVNDNINSLTKGEEVRDFEDGVDLIKINPHTSAEIKSTWSEDKELATII